MAGVKTIVGLGELSDCPVCCGKDGVPKLLPCTHTMCADCIKSMLKAKREENVLHGRPTGNKIVCPLCRSDIEIPDGNVDNIPTNLLVKQLQDMVENIMVKKSTTKTAARIPSCCQVCDVNKTVDQYCKQCTISMCLPCAKKHAKTGIYRDHQVVTRALLFCGTHGSQFTHMCERCNGFLCGSCISDGLCRRHPVILIDDIRKERRNDIDELIQTLSDKIDITGTYGKPALASIDKNIRQAKKLRIEVDVHAKQLQSQFNRNKQRLLKEIDDWEQKLVQAKKRLDIDKDLKVMEELLQSSLSAKEQGDEQIMKALPDIKSKLPSRSCLPDEKLVNKQYKFVKQNSLSIGSLESGGEKETLRQTRTVRSQQTGTSASLDRLDNIVASGVSSAMPFAGDLTLPPPSPSHFPWEGQPVVSERNTPSSDYPLRPDFIPDQGVSQPKPPNSPSHRSPSPFPRSPSSFPYF